MSTENQEERVSATPCSPASAPPAISSAPGAASDAAPDATELVDLSPCTPPPPPALASGSPPVVELQLELPGAGAEQAAPPPPPPGAAAAAAARPRRSVIPRQLKRNSVAPAPREPLRTRQAAKQSSGGCLFPDTLRPADKPRDALQTYFHQLDSPEWEVAMQGLQTLVRLCRHHPDTVQANLHAVLVALGRQVRNLRSQVSRAACQAAGELFLALKRALETDLDELVVPLFHRAADTNKFLRADSNAALDRMVETISTGRAIAAICCKGATHQHALVRTTAARLLAGVVTRLGAERTMSLPRDTRDKVLLTGANLLTEGSLDTRCHAKQMFRVLAAQHNLVFVMTEVVPPPLMRNIAKTLQALK
ncbi:TOG array regulator of axonemal microtubules protein 2 [Bacillus rossius redtenbacheri]|uniref:TOG array regulator of axonemal microtubules protein 2 n=1 Tax=Bacillus rossius redtenbacheri TaxID=93214 RepID=UPI002FDD54C6